MLKVKVLDIINVQTAIEKLNNLSTTEKLNFKLMYKVTKLFKAIKPELASYSEERLNLLKKLGVPGSEPDTYTIPTENFEEFKTALEFLHNDTIELYNVPVFKLDEFDNVTGFTIDDIVGLTPFLEKDEEEVVPETSKKVIKLNEN